MANKRLLRLHFSQFRSLPIKNNTDAIVLPSPVVTTQGENGLPPSGAGADFSFASSDFKTLGAFFCNFPASTGDGSSPGAAWVSERRTGAGEAARLDRLSVRRAGEASEILFRFRAISMLCEAENFLPAPRVEFDNVLAAPGRSARSAARPCTRCCGFQAPETIPFPGADSIFSSRCGAISERGRLAVSARDLSSGLGLTQKQEKSESATTADPPPCSAARREARVGRRAQALLDGRTSLTAGPWGYRVGETMKNPSTSCVYQ